MVLDLTCILCWVEITSTAIEGRDITVDSLTAQLVNTEQVLKISEYRKLICF